jgi:hypothetical protein
LAVLRCCGPALTPRGVTGRRWAGTRRSRRRAGTTRSRRCVRDADEAQKAESGPVFNRLWFMIVGGLEYLSRSGSTAVREMGRGWEKFGEAGRVAVDLLPFLTSKGP